MMKAIIIGSSIAGASAACLLAKHAQVEVYEQKRRQEVGKKVCANVCTGLFKSLVRKFGLNPVKFIKTKYNSVTVFSEKNSASFPTSEYEIDRGKLIEALIKKAQENGARFYFNSKVTDIKKGKRHEAVIRQNNKQIKREADVIIGADGALSGTAKKCSLWGNRELWLCLQTKVSGKDIKNKQVLPKKNSYNIFVNKKMGYYAYIFPSKDKFVAGAGDTAENAAIKFRNFMKFCKISRFKTEGALIPVPQIIRPKQNVYLIGDAGCNLKFTGGGILPSFMAAIALNDILVNNDKSNQKKLNFSISLNRIAARMFGKFDNRQFDKFLELMKNKKYQSLIARRDMLSKTEMIKAMHPKILLMIARSLF